MIESALAEGCTSIRLHILLDGRDVGETSALDYVQPLVDRCEAWSKDGVDVRVASGGAQAVLYYLLCCITYCAVLLTVLYYLLCCITDCPVLLTVFSP